MRARRRFLSGRHWPQTGTSADDYPDTDASTAACLAELRYAFEAYGNLLTWRYDVKMNTAKWSQKYVNDDLGRLIAAEQDAVDSWANKTWANAPVDKAWQWHEPGG